MGYPLRDVGVNLKTHQVGAPFEVLVQSVLMGPLGSMYTQVNFNLIFVQVCTIPWAAAAGPIEREIL